MKLFVIIVIRSKNKSIKPILHNPVKNVKIDILIRSLDLIHR